MPKGTREKIINAFFRCANRHPDIHHFTIAEIAKEAGISRQAVQRKHYANVEELIIDIRTQVNDKIQEELSLHSIKEKLSPYQVIAVYTLPIIYDHRDWLKVLSTTCMDPNWAKIIEKQHKEWFSQFLVEDIYKTGFSRDFALNFIVKEVFNVISSWLSEELPEPPLTFSKKFLFLTLHSEKIFISSEYHNNGLR